MDLLNLSTGKPEAIDSSDIAKALASGTHVPVDGGKAVISPDGQLGILPANALGSASQSGYTVPTQDQLNQFAYGGDLNSAKSIGAAFLRGPTFGGSDYALTRTGLASPETLKGLKEANPVASALGEGLGVAASVILTPEARGASALGGAEEASAATRAFANTDLLSPARAVNKLGQHVTAAVLPEGAGALSTIASHAAGTAVEGSLYGAGQSISEAALGDPDAAAEHLVANVGFGALIGGGLGGLLEAGQLAIPKSVGNAKDALAGVYKSITGRVPEAAEAGAGAGLEDIPVPPQSGDFQSSPLSRAAAVASGKPEEEVLADLNKGFNSEPMTDLERKQYAGKSAEAFQTYDNALSKLERDTMGPARAEETATLINQTADQSKIVPEYQRLVNKADFIAKAMREEPELYPAGAAREMELVQERLEKLGPSADPYERFDRLNDAKRETYAHQDAYIGKGKRPTPSERRAGELIREVYEELKGSLENPDVWGAAGARQAAVNEAYSGLKDARKIFYKRFGENNGKRVVMSGTRFNTHFNAINDPVRAPLREEALNNFLAAGKRFTEEAEKTHQATSFENVDITPLKAKLEKAGALAERSKNIVKAAPGGLGFFTDLFNPAGSILRAAKTLTNPEQVGAILANIERANQKVGTKISRGVKVIFKPVGSVKKGFGILSEKLSPAQKVESIKRKIDEVREQGSSAENLADTLNKATIGGADAAPKTMAAAQAIAIRGVQFLQSKIPVTPQVTPFEEPVEPNQDQLIAFERYYHTVHNPLSILDEMAGGTLVPQSVEALQAVYPRLYASIQQEAIEHVSGIKDKSTIPYRTRLVLSQFMGQPLDQSLTPASLQAVQTVTQMVSSGPNGQEPAAPHPTMTGLGKLNVASRIATPFQQSASRGA